MKRTAIAVSALLLAALASALSGARAQDGAADARKATLAEVSRLLRESDSFAAIEHVQANGSAAEVAERYAEVVRDLYWTAKDLRGAIAVGRAAVLHCLAASRAAAKDDPAAARRFRVLAQELSFDLASFAWPGWDEKGIAIGPADLEAGLDFARLDLRLVEEMSYPPEKHATARWIVGAQLLAARRWADARREFGISRDRAREAKAADKEWMAHGYLGIVAALESPADPAGRRQVDEAVGRLRALGTADATAYADQLGSVLAALSR